MKATIEIKETEKNTFEAILECEKEKVVSRWTIGPNELVGIEHKGIDKLMLAFNNLGKQVISEYARARMYPPGDPTIPPAARKAASEKKPEK